MNICVDASIVIKWLMPEEGSDQALKLYETWDKNGVHLIAPDLIDYEVGSTIRQKVIRRQIDSHRLFPILDTYRRVNLFLVHLPDLVSQAVSAAASLDQPTIYDIAYLLTAQQQNADYVTADKRFCRSVQPLYSFVKYYKEYS